MLPKASTKSIVCLRREGGNLQRESGTGEENPVQLNGENVFAK
jgi:hypothetical protein